MEIKMKKGCVRCKQAIDTARERYVVVKDNEGKNNIKTIYYHKACWHEVMTGKATLNNFMQRAENIFGFAESKIGKDGDTVYEIK